MNEKCLECLMTKFTPSGHKCKYCGDDGCYKHIKGHWIDGRCLKRDKCTCDKDAGRFGRCKLSKKKRCPDV